MKNKSTKKFADVVNCAYLCSRNRDVAQLVAHTSGGREVASSSLVIPTCFRAKLLFFSDLAFCFCLSDTICCRVTWLLLFPHL